MSEIVTLSEAAQRLGIHVTTIRTWVREQRIPSLRVGGRFARLDWHAVLQALHCPAHPLANGDGGAP